MAVRSAAISRAQVERIVREAVEKRLGANGRDRRPSAPQLVAPAPERRPRRVRPSRSALALFNSKDAEKLKAEIITTGRKLWHRQYVDGNGGNISCRIGRKEVLCTPTLFSKYDLTPDELCMVDLDGNQLVGSLPRTSEILLHLEIYKAVPHARGVVHCHPPHATAYAITGRVPPTAIVPEYEVFVGAVALAPYETPGTKRFAETVLPFIRHHNTVLLGNHGVVCWADTVTHAEWCAEVLETYCWILTIAAQLGAPINRIPAAKAEDLLRVKKRLGLPDPRFAPDAFQLEEDAALPVAGIALPPPVPRHPSASPAAEAEETDVEGIVREVTEAVMAAIRDRGRA